MERKLNPLRLKEADIYDVLAYLIRKFGLLRVTTELRKYFINRTDMAFSKVDLENPDGTGTELGQARAWDACLVLLECLEAKCQEYQLDTQDA